MKHRTYTSEDQAVFANLSGDHNPLHVDAIAARRMLFGAPVVHGIHGLMWALDCYLEDKKDHVTLTSIKASFTKPIKVGEEVHLEIKNDDGKNFSIALLNDEVVLAYIKVKLVKSAKSTLNHFKSCSPEAEHPRALSDDGIEAESGTFDLCLNVDAAITLFPNLLRCVSPSQIAVILGTTRLVGSICPGLHSIYSELELFTTDTIETSNNSIMQYEVTKYDKRISRVYMKVNANDMTGNIMALRRPEPQQQEDYQRLKHKVNNNEFATQGALIIGGSRGLGEVAAKLLAAGGANVRITYHQGKKDASVIVEDIVSNGGLADCFQFNVLNPENTPLDLTEDWAPTHLYYFATPAIATGKKTFSPALFKKFCDYYVTGFSNTLNQLSDTGISHIFYPSTVFIDELPGNFGEYAVAKIAGELLCAFLEKSNPQLTIVKPRFPKVATDQTVSLLPDDSKQDPVNIILEELRSFQDA